MSALVTIAMAVYGQPEMLGVWMDTLRSYAPALLEKLELIVVDDCGDPKAALPEDVRAALPCQLFRVLQDIPWNQPGARNLALEHVRTPLVLFVDPDMVFPEPMMRTMVAAGAALPRGRVIRFCLKHRTGPSAGKLDKTSPNTWFLHAADLRAVKGYDEDFSGRKGWSDVQLLDVLRTAYRVSHNESLFADFYGNDEIPDAAVSKLDRSTAGNRKLRVNNVRIARQMGGWIKFAKRAAPKLRFQWERVL